MNSYRNQDLGLRYLRVANSLRSKIVEGTYRPGERLPRQHDMAQEYNVAFGTLKQALDLLEREGYVVRKVGQGTYAALPEEHMPTALVVDDEESIRSFLSAALEDSGWRSVAVGSGQMALEKFKERRFDLIFLDMVMPGMNGVDTLREIRKLDPDANVVIITAYVNSALTAEALQIGPFTVMGKPFGLEELRMVLGNTVGHPERTSHG